MSSLLYDKMNLFQKLSFFCLQFGTQLTAAKERLRSGERLDEVLDELFLFALADLCRTLGCPVDPEFFSSALHNTGDHSQQQQQKQVWSQMLNCVSTSMKCDDDGDGEGEDDDEEEEEEDEYEHGEDFCDDAEYFYKQKLQQMLSIQQQKQKQNSNQNQNQNQQHQSKLFYCEYPDCGKSFRRQTDLKSHFGRHNATKLFECAWPECTFKSTYSSSVGEHIGKLHFKCQTRGPDRDNYLDEAKKWIRKIEEADGSKAGGSSNGGGGGNISSPFPTGPFLCCGRTFSNSFNLTKHQSSRKCVSKLVQQPSLNPQESQEPKPSTSFAEAAAAAVAAFSKEQQQQQQQSTSSFNGGHAMENDECANGGAHPLKKAKREVEEESEDTDSDD